MLYINNTKISDIKLNNRNISKVYLNNILVFQKKYYFTFDSESAGWDKGEWSPEGIFVRPKYHYTVTYYYYNYNNTYTEVDKTPEENQYDTELYLNYIVPDSDLVYDGKTYILDNDRSVLKIYITSDETKNKIMVYFDVDIWDEKSETPINSPDGIPDKLQSVVNYSLNNSTYGSIQKTRQVLTINNGKINISNVATAKTDGKFEYWEIGTEKIYTSILNKEIALSSAQILFCKAYFSKVENKLSIQKVSGAQYGFVLNSSGYYESQNKGINSSYSLCKISIECTTVCNVKITYINSGENKYDFGILGKLDTPLSLSNTVDSTYALSLKGQSSTTAETYTYSNISAGNHEIYIKYRKDVSGSSGNDSLQFKAEFV